MGRYKPKINFNFNHKHYFLGCMIFINIKPLHVSSCFLILIASYFLPLNPKTVLKAFGVFSSCYRLRTEAYEGEVICPGSLIKFNQRPRSPDSPLCAPVSGASVKCPVTPVSIFCQIWKSFITTLRRSNGFSFLLASKLPLPWVSAVCIHTSTRLVSPTSEVEISACTTVEAVKQIYPIINDLPWAAGRRELLKVSL